MKISSLLKKSIAISRCFSTKKDLYNILGVSKSASKQDIRSAYYKLAKQHHPDRNPDPKSKQKFSQINNAYETLSNQNKRKVYDQTGMTGDQAGQQGFGNYQDIFSGGSQGFGSFQDILNNLFGGSRRGRQRNMNGQDINQTIDIQFQESVKGVQKEIKVRRQQKCSTCKGSKAKPGTNPVQCSSCNGSGRQQYRSGPMFFSSTCSSCNGQGKVIKHHCGTCKGTGLQMKLSSQKVHIKPGARNKTIYKYSGKGHNSNYGRPGDLLIQIRVKPSKQFTRDGNDVYSKSKINLWDAVLGTTIQIKLISGLNKTINIPSGTQHGDKLKIQREGFEKNNYDKGNHIVILQIQVPKILSPQQRKAYQTLRSLSNEKTNK